MASSTVSQTVITGIGIGILVDSSWALRQLNPGRGHRWGDRGVGRRAAAVHGAPGRSPDLTCPAVNRQGERTHRRQIAPKRLLRAAEGR